MLFPAIHTSVSKFVNTVNLMILADCRLHKITEMIAIGQAEKSLHEGYFFRRRLLYTEHRAGLRQPDAMDQNGLLRLVSSFWAWTYMSACFSLLVRLDS
jgi:hypothetical protein